MWRASDLVECLIFIGLALMLAYTVFVSIRFSLRYYSACRKFRDLLSESTVGVQTGQKALIADLSRGVGKLKAIASAAPFLALAGTIYGILCLFARGLFWSYDWSPSQTAAALVSTASGLIVAVPAAISYNIFCTRLEKFENGHSSKLLAAAPRSYGFAQTLSLRSRFSGLPAFALIGAPVLGLLIPMFAIMLAPAIPVGLPVHLLKIGAGDHDLPPIIVSVVAPNGSSRPVVYVNSKETSWDELGSTLRSELKVRPRWIVYVAGADRAPWAEVADAIDVARGLHAEVVLVTAAPNVGSDDGRNNRLKGKARTK